MVGYFLWRTASTDLALTGVDTLLTRDISKSSAMQRAGRAGREVCGSSSMGEVSDRLTGRWVLFSAVSKARS